jgi:hypothetical protein
MLPLLPQGLKKKPKAAKKPKAEGEKKKAAKPKSDKPKKPKAKKEKKEGECSCVSSVSSCIKCFDICAAHAVKCVWQLIDAAQEMHQLPALLLLHAVWCAAAMVVSHCTGANPSLLLFLLLQVRRRKPHPRRLQA